MLEQTERKKILWLVSWYPDRDDAFNGDFIQRHARAASLKNDIHVLYVKASSSVSTVVNDLKQTNCLTEQLIYYPKTKGILSFIIKQYNWFQIYKSAVINYISQNGLPHLVHVHVPWKAGIMALWIKRTYGVPFVITEHWDIYNHVVEDNFFRKSLAVQWITKKIFSTSVLLISVSHFISHCINTHIAKSPVSLINNSVDTSIFFFKQKENKPFTFLHVSNMVAKKNVAGILKAFKKFIQENNFLDARLVMVGNTNAHYEIYSKELGLEKHVLFKGELPYTEVAKQMQTAHCMVLNSTMENAPCVIGEAHCCGLPIIATNVGGIPEMVDESNGLLIEPNDEAALTQALKIMMERYDHFDGKAISEASYKRYAYAPTARRFDEICKKVIKSIRSQKELKGN